MKKLVTLGLMALVLGSGMMCSEKAEQTSPTSSCSDFERMFNQCLGKKLEPQLSMIDLEKDGYDNMSDREKFQYRQHARSCKTIQKKCDEIWKTWTECLEKKEASKKIGAPTPTSWY